MIDAGDPGPIYSKRKAITALFPYAVWQEQDGQHKVLDVCLHAAQGLKAMALSVVPHQRASCWQATKWGEPCFHTAGLHTYVTSLTMVFRIWMGMNTGSNSGQQQPQQSHIQMRLVKV
jgi:hypothetical protein